MSTRLHPPDRDLFEQVARAAFLNPFGAERAALDATLAADAPKGPGDLVDRVLVRLRVRLDWLESVGRLDVTGFDTRDAELLEHAILFERFHRFGPDFERLLVAQLAAPERTLPVPFADALLGGLTGAGVAPARAERLMALFWQMRRAYHFIDRGLVGRSEAMRALRADLWNAVFTADIERYDRFLWDRMEDFSVLLLGETGTGKGAAAAAIGRAGFVPWDPHRRAFADPFTESFVPLNLSEFPETLIESALFGHAKGAFTGAVADYDGAFTRCRPHGAVFLDEIGEVRTPVQIKLLRVLEERAYTPVGGTTPRRFDGRVLAATHRSLDRLRADGRFRDDFYHRLCCHVIAVPPLRTRIAEAPAELDDLLAVVVERILGQPDAALCAEVRAAIDRDLSPDHPWPGNVRELAQRARRVMLTGGCAEPPPAVSAARDPFLGSVGAGELDARDLIEGYCARLYKQHGTYEEVARRTGLDRRTVRKYVKKAQG